MTGAIEVEESLAAMAEGLRTLGALDRGLDAEERRILDEEGVLVLEDHFDAGRLDEFRRRYDELVGDDGWALNIVDKGDLFKLMWTDPKLLSAAYHIIRRPFRLGAMNGRSALPGSGQQKLHADFNRPRDPAVYSVVNSMWFLDDLTEHNGATRYVPGSHRSERKPTDDLADPRDPHPKERLLLGRAGSMAILNAHVWHGGTLNTTDRPRRVIACAFGASEFPQQVDQRATLPAEMIGRLTPAERWLLDV